MALPLIIITPFTGIIEENVMKVTSVVNKPNKKYCRAYCNIIAYLQKLEEYHPYLCGYK